LVESVTRAERLASLERWADAVDPRDLREAETASLRTLAELAAQRNGLERDIAEVVQAARASKRTWSEIGAILGVSKQAAQRRYGPRQSAA
jgi:hypothetical protein